MTGEVGFFINNDSGIRLTYNGGANNGNNLQFSGKVVMDKIKEALSIQEDDCVLIITGNLSVNPKGMFFKVIGRRDKV